MMTHKLLALALAAGCSFHAQAIELGKSQTLTSPDQVPEGLNPADWSSIRSAYSTGHTAKAAGVISQQAYVKASSIGVNDEFGYSVAVSGDTVVVGATGEDSSTRGVNTVPNEAANESGAAYVFVRSGGVWTQQAYLKANNTSDYNYFGTSVAISGDTIVVGATSESSIAGNSGAAYVFTRSGVLWSQQARLKASNAESYSNFGTSVAVSGETIVVGSSNEGNDQDEDIQGSGAAYVFARSGSSWSQQAFLKASNDDEGDKFGISVAVSGETIVVGADGEDSSTIGVNSIPNEAANESGAAYIYTRSGVNWSEQAYLKANNTDDYDYFGGSVAISGETIVVGAIYEDSGTYSSGAAYVFTRSGVMWSEQAYLKASNSGEEDYFGSSVAISGETIVIGASGEASNAVGVNGDQADNNASGSGAVYVFARSGVNWSQQAYLKASNTGRNDYFGTAVAVSGSTVISGAPYENGVTSGINSVPNTSISNIKSGAVYIYAPAPVVPPAVVKYLVSVKVSNSKLGKVTGIGSFDTGSTVTLSARAKKGHKFTGWYEKKKLVTKKKLLVIKNLTANRSFVAKFK